MGDLLFVDCHPTFFEESNPENWIRILEKVSDMDVEIAIPGHGSIGTKIRILELIDYITDLTVIAREKTISKILKYLTTTKIGVLQRFINRILKC